MPILFQLNRINKTIKLLRFTTREKASNFVLKPSLLLLDVVISVFQIKALSSRDGLGFDLLCIGEGNAQKVALPSELLR